MARFFVNRYLRREKLANMGACGAFQLGRPGHFLKFSQRLPGHPRPKVASQTSTSPSHGRSRNQGDKQAGKSLATQKLLL